MSNVIQFGSKRINTESKPKAHYGGVIDTTLNKALLTVQHCALVSKDTETAGELLRAVADCDLLSQWITLPGKFIEAFESTDTEATYRAILGVPED